MADVFYNRKVTIFNCYTDDLMGDETWVPTVLDEVRLLETKGLNVTESGNNEADSAKLFIRTDNLAKPYCDPIAWSKLADKTSCFTLCQDRDFFVEGDKSDVTPTTGFFEYMKSNYDAVYKVSTVDKLDIIPHLEVGGR